MIYNNKKNDAYITIPTASAIELRADDWSRIRENFSARNAFIAGAIWFRDSTKLSQGRGEDNGTLTELVKRTHGLTDTRTVPSDKIICANCDGEGWVCEDHPEVPWNGGDGCCGGAGMLCKCNNANKPAQLAATQPKLLSREEFMLVIDERYRHLKDRLLQHGYKSEALWIYDFLTKRQQ